MSDPIADASSPGEQDLIDADAKMPDSPSAESLCKFKFPPGLPWSLKFKIPAFAFPPPIPFPSIPIGINCSLKNPISLTANIPNGGGRRSKADPDPDDE